MIRLSPYIRHSPTTTQLGLLLLDDIREVLFGGAAGGGKSDGLMMAGLQYVEQPDYSCLILRRTFPQLAGSGGLLELAATWLGPYDVTPSNTINGLPTKWSFRSGATLTFGHMQHESDRFNFQGHAYDAILFDELSQFTETQYRYLFSRLRRGSQSRVPPRVRGATNPPETAEGQWVKRRFAIPNQIATQALVHPEHDERVFLPSKLDDNPHLDRESYVESLRELDPVTRARLLEGDWGIRDSSDFFDRSWFDVVDAPPKANGKPVKRVRYWDLAATVPKPGTDPDYLVGTRQSHVDGEFFVEHVDRRRLPPGKVKQHIIRTAHADGKSVHVVVEQEPGSTGKIAVDDLVRALPGYVVRGDRVTGKKTERAAPFASQAEAGHVHLVEGQWISNWLDEIERFPGVEHDDQVDSASGGFGYLAPRRDKWSEMYGDQEEAVA